MAVLRCRTVRELISICRSDQQAWIKLKRFYKNVGVKAYPEKRGKISDLVLEGGKYEFQKDNEHITVEVSTRSLYRAMDFS